MLSNFGEIPVVHAIVNEHLWKQDSIMSGRWHLLCTPWCTNICENKTPLCQGDGTCYAQHCAQTFVKTIRGIPLSQEDCTTVTVSIPKDIAMLSFYC